MVGERTNAHRHGSVDFHEGRGGDTPAAAGALVRLDYLSDIGEFESEIVRDVLRAIAAREPELAVT